ncbi:CHAT domain-containing protein [Adonisia turfae]|uniref:CHAT domain-containing protein n=1 Tax=Adonisia turfae CCMR0081 TaxID=2292702 RepID=A0A6M0RED6_9CYAN|nr:CHAT domain-containing protein [Adonisia turfae]NEZ54122.1 CHAT domain-containing protein [Adonisia turfae CCMR0081]
MRRILVTTANPRGTVQLRLDEEIREIDEGLKRSPHRTQFELIAKVSVRLRDFYRHMLEFKPHIVHFSGHGDGVNGLVFESDNGEPEFLGTEPLAEIFKLFASRGLECVVLNACYSEIQAKAINRCVPYVIAMNDSIGDRAAITFSVAFYDALGANETINFALELAKTQLINLKEHQKPIILTNPDLIARLRKESFKNDIIPREKALKLLQSLLPSQFESVDRNSLLNQLQQLNESQLDELVYRLHINQVHLRASGVSLNQRPTDLIQYLEPQVAGLQQLQVQLENLLSPPTESTSLTQIPECPYQGLFAFQESNADFFFGREAFIDDCEQENGSIRQGLVRAVETLPLVAVVGSSGSGKSSLVFAGLLPRLRQSNGWFIETLRPKKAPFVELAVQLAQRLDPVKDLVDQNERVNKLTKSIREGGIVSVVSQILQPYPGKQLLLVIDQFEELYTQCDQPEREQFIDVVLEGLNRAEGFKVVLTLRADFCGQAYAYRPLADALHGADFKLGPMNREELQKAIECPAKLREVKFEDGLVDRLLDDVGKEDGNLPLLEFALTELWRRQQHKTLTYQAYVRIGGVAKALARHADAVYMKLSEVDQKRAQQVFVQLVHPGEGTEDTRRVASRTEIGPTNWDLVTQLAGEPARLVVTGRNEETVEIIHETLLKEWQSLRGWLEQDRTFRLWQEGLRFRQRQWQQSKQDETALLDGFLLEEAKQWQSQRHENLSVEDKAFIRLSSEARDRRVQSRLHELEELLEQERKAVQAKEEAIAQANRAKKVEQQKSRLAAAATGLVVIASLTGGFLWRRGQQLQFQIALFDAGVEVTPKTAAAIVRRLPEQLKAAQTAEVGLENNKTETNITNTLQHYRQMRERSIKLLEKADQEPEIYQDIIERRSDIQPFAGEAESSLARLVRLYRLPQLEVELSTQPIGLRDEKQGAGSFEDQFPPGALRTTYRILMQEFGVEADLDGNGLLDSQAEAAQIPCLTLIDIAKAWREATANQCGWYSNDPKLDERDRYLDENTDCEDLRFSTLTNQIFNIPDDNAILDRFEQCQVSRLVISIAPNAE